MTATAWGKKKPRSVFMGETGQNKSYWIFGYSIPVLKAHRMVKKKLREEQGGSDSPDYSQQPQSMMQNPENCI